MSAAGGRTIGFLYCMVTARIVQERNLSCDWRCSSSQKLMVLRQRFEVIGFLPTIQKP